MPTKTYLLAEPPPRPDRSSEMERRTSSIQQSPFGISDDCGRSNSAWRFFPACGVLAFAFLSVAARFGLHWDLPIPQCWLRKFTGIPCPTCGCTRSLAAWSEMNLGQAFHFNPLFFCVCVALMIWGAVSAVERLSGRAFLPSLRVGLRRWPWWKLGILLVAVNWLYLCLTLPK